LLVLLFVPVCYKSRTARGAIDESGQVCCLLDLLVWFVSKNSVTWALRRFAVLLLSVMWFIHFCCFSLFVLFLLLLFYVLLFFILIARFSEIRSAALNGQFATTVEVEDSLYYDAVFQHLILSALEEEGVRASFNHGVFHLDWKQESA
jgi:hypothetical protein